MDMYRKLTRYVAALVGAVPAATSAQSSSAERAREKERERIEREREKEQERLERAREQEQEKLERAREQRQQAAERARERAERDRERQRERAERERAGSLDTVVVFDAKGSVSVTCPGGSVVVVGSDKNEIRVRARTENGAIRFTSNGSRAILEPTSGRGCSDGHFEVTVPVGSKVVATTWSGSVVVRGVHGDVEAHSQSGDVQVRDAGGRLDVESEPGRGTTVFLALPLGVDAL
jgi:chemotaxis protein histidine kinase CheA